MKSILCPVSVKKIDSNVSRLTIFFNVLLMVFFLLTKNPVIIGFVALDYFIRAVLKVEYSPIRFLAYHVVSILRLKKKPIGLAQKIFASRLGFLCALTSTILMFLGFSVAAMWIALILVLLSTLDSVFNFCVGCLIYNYLIYPFYKEGWFDGRSLFIDLP